MALHNPGDVTFPSSGSVCFSSTSRHGKSLSNASFRPLMPPPDGKEPPLFWLWIFLLAPVESATIFMGHDSPCFADTLECDHLNLSFSNLLGKILQKGSMPAF
ncbi:hypothetical protein Hdeb2414_s0023g00622091 [Helianthus debilis subsp. tardiflorus]